MLSCVVVTCWEKANLLALLCVIFFFCVFVTFSCGVLDQVWYLLVSIPDLCFLTYFCHDKILLKLWYSKVLTMNDSQQTLSDFEYNMLRWANKNLNEPKLLTRVVDFMVSEDFFINFLWVYPQVCGGQFEPQGNRLQRVGWIYVVNHYALLQTKYKSYWLHGFRLFFNVFPHYKEADNRPSWQGQVGEYFFHNTWSYIDHRGVAICDSRGLIGRIYVGAY